MVTVTCAEERWENMMTGSVQLRLIEKDFKQRIRDSLGEEMCTGIHEIQVIPIPVTDPRFQTVTKKEHFLSSKTSMGIDFMLLGKAQTKRRYMSEIYVLSALSVSSTVAPVFIEAAIIVDTPTPYPLFFSKKSLLGEGPLTDLLTVDERLGSIIMLVSENHNTFVDQGNRRIKINLDMEFKVGIIPMKNRTLVAMRSLAGFSYGLDDLVGVVHVFNYGIQRPAIEILGRLAFYVQHLAYDGVPSQSEDSEFLIGKVLHSVGMLKEGE
ncbi:MAG: hypothetical protein KAR33_01520 [Candidatus Thorarchaeota archaeon]|nr:hypothetical protein [Candidatus Thorarchaeota archaeon]